MNSYSDWEISDDSADLEPSEKQDESKDKENGSNWVPSDIWTKKDVKSDYERGPFESVLLGRMESLPRPTSNVVRVFISSTFTDMHAERNLLITEIFPKLASYCRDKHGMDFQAVDMRWGVREVAALDHSASALCMREINLCQKQSAGPTFLMLLGDRYGNQPLPATIPSAEMDHIKSYLDKDLSLVQEWYLVDTNAIPSVYVLQNIDKGMDPKDVAYSKAIEKARSSWAETSQQLISCIRDAVCRCIEAGKMNESEMQKYFWSITEEEIECGLMQDSDPVSHCLAFRRKLTDLNVHHNKAWRFIDQNSDGSINQDAQKRKEQLHERVLDTLPKENLYEFSTKWSDNDGVNEVDNEEYLTEFGATFQKALIKIIDAQAKKGKEIRNKHDEMKDVYIETLEHAHQCVTKVERFHGRGDILDQIYQYIQSDSQQPLIIHGKSGCGKTSVLAKAAMQIPELLGDDENLCILLRFLGTTPDSSSVYNTLGSLYQQIVAFYQIRGIPMPFDVDIPKEFSDMKDLYYNVLQWMSTDTNSRLVLFLDSLDQLSPAGNSYNLTWLPAKLPSNIKLVVSTLPNEHRLLETLKNKHFGLDKTHFVKVDDLDRDTIQNILTLWLQTRKRKLTENQYTIASKVLSRNIRALFLKLIFDELIQWKSYQENVQILTEIRNTINALFDKLELKHGKVLVSHALFYLSSSKNGLTEHEMEDLLSLDEDVLTDVFQFHVAPVRRLPSVLWSRIRSDVSEYIVDREADGVKVMGWYHRQFIEAAKVRYVEYSSRYHARKSEESINQGIRQVIMKEYFSGKWADNKDKPFQYTEYQMKKLNLDNAEAAAKRYVAPQPTVFGIDRTENGEMNIRFNQRKITELSNIIVQITERENNIDEWLDLIVTDVQFLMGYVEHQQWTDVINSLIEVGRDSRYGNNNESQQSCMEIGLVQQALLMSYTSIVDNFTMLGPSIASRLLAFYPELPQVSRLIENIDSDGLKYCALVNPGMQLEIPGGEMVFVMNNHQGAVTDITSTNNPDYGDSSDDEASISVSRKLVAVDMEAGEIISDLRPLLPEDDIFHKVVYVSQRYEKEEKGVPSICVASLTHHPWIYIFNMQTGNVEEKGIIKVNDYCSDEFIIDEILTIKHKDIIVTGKASPHIFMFSDLVNGGKMHSHHRYDKPIICGTSMQVHGYFKESSSDASDEEDNVKENSKEDFPDLHLLLVHPDKISLVGGSFDHFLDEKDLTSSYGQVISHASIQGVILFAFPNGSIIAAVCESTDSSLKIQLHEFDLNLDYPHSMHCARPRYGESENFVFAACTKSRLTLMNVDNMKASVQASVKKYYTGAHVTKSAEKILAYVDGTVDVFEVRNTGDKGSKIRLLVSIDAHGAPITKLFVPAGESDFFMSASEDGTMKFWILEKAGMTRKIVPNFDRTKAVIRGIISSNMTALTIDKDHSSLDHWDLVTSRRIQRCQVGQHIQLVAATLAHTSMTVVAVDRQGSVIGWQLEDNEDNLISLRSQVFSGEISPFVTPCYMSRAGILLGTDPPLLLPIDGLMEIWIITSKDKQCKWYVCESRTGSISEVNQVLNLHVDKAFSIDQEQLALVSFENSEICICSKKTGNTSVHSFSMIFQNDVPVKSVQVERIKEGFAAITSKEVILWKSEKGTSTSVKMPENLSFNQCKTSGDGLVLALESADMVSFINTKDACLIGNYKKKSSKASKLNLTSDGQYFIHLSERRDLTLVRVKDQRILANYTAYGDIATISISANDFFVCMGTNDRRLFILLIADPDEPQHKERIKLVRKISPKLSHKSVMTLLQLQNDDSSERPEIDVVAWSDAESDLDMGQEGRQSRMRRATTTLSLHNNPKSKSARRREATALSMLAENCEGSVVHSSNLCSLQ